MLRVAEVAQKRLSRSLVKRKILKSLKSGAYVVRRRKLSRGEEKKGYVKRCKQV